MGITMISPASQPRLAPGTRLHHDAARDRWLLLAPERAILLDETALEIMRLVDGHHSVDAIVDELLTLFDAPREDIAADVLALLDELNEKGLLTA
jgi:pyrroloquinoline quinone biosynthesis protein D